MNSKTTLWGLPGDIVTGCKINNTAIWRIFINRTLFFTFIFTFIFLNYSNAQNENIPTYMSTINPVKAASLEEDGWKGAFLNTAGMNFIRKVEVFSQLGKCESEDVIFLKLINHNDYDVKVEWLGGVYTKDRQRLEDPEGMRSITIKANEEVIGDCSNNKLLMRLKDYIDSADNFNRYAPLSFEVTLER